MLHSGEYPQPLPRRSVFHVPVVGGFTTARLGTDVVAVSGYDKFQTRVLLKNTGKDNATIQLVGTNDYISGPRVNIGGAITLVPRGEKFQTFSPIYRYLEVSATAGTSTLYAQLESIAEWQLMAFDKSEAIYPAALTKKWPDPYPVTTVVGYTPP